MAVSRRNKKKETPEMTNAMLDEVTIKALDTGVMGCPTIEIQAYQKAVDEEFKTLKMFAKAQQDVRKAIQLRLTEILESIDPANIGKSRLVYVKNPNFDRTKERTDSDEKGKRCEGDNPFFVKDWIPLYDPERFSANTILSMINMARGENKDVVKELKDAKKKLLAAQREARKAKDALDEVEAQKYESAADEPLVSFEFEEDNSKSLN